MKYRVREDNNFPSWEKLTVSHVTERLRMKDVLHFTGTFVWNSFSGMSGTDT